ncbi:hypothetical protein ACTMNS_13160, partial [Staphylococcus haemolyticus]
VLVLRSVIKRVFNPKPNNLDRRFRIYRETLSRFSCAASLVKIYINLMYTIHRFLNHWRNSY